MIRPGATFRYLALLLLLGFVAGCAEALPDLGLQPRSAPAGAPTEEATTSLPTELPAVGPAPTDVPGAPPTIELSPQPTTPEGPTAETSPLPTATVTGSIQSLEPGSGLIHLLGPSSVFHSVAVNASTQIVSKDAGIQQPADLKAGMQIEAVGQPAGTGILLATTIKVLAVPAAPGQATWQRVSVPDPKLSFDAPAGWKRSSAEWAWSNPKAATQRVGFKWTKRQGGVEPTSLLPDHSISLDSTSIETKFGQAIKYTVQVTSMSGGVGLETHAIILTDTLIYDWYAAAVSPDELDSLWPILQHMIDSAA